jgi:hypothetical protein
MREKNGMSIAVVGMPAGSDEGGDRRDLADDIHHG